MVYESIILLWYVLSFFFAFMYIINQILFYNICYVLSKAMLCFKKYIYKPNLLQGCNGPCD